MLICRWHGEYKNCSDLFQSTKTDDGFCCSFNTVSLAEGFSNVDLDVSAGEGSGDYDDYGSYDYLDYYDYDYGSGLGSDSAEGSGGSTDDGGGSGNGGGRPVIGYNEW